MVQRPRKDNATLQNLVKRVCLVLPSQLETEKGTPKENRDKILMERLAGWRVISDLELLVINVCIIEQQEAGSGWALAVF